LQYLYWDGKLQRLGECMNHFLKAIVVMVAASCVLLCSPTLFAQAGRGGGRGAAPPTAKASAPIDLTGMWTSVVTEDWHLRMVTAPKGDFGVGAPGAVVLPGGGAFGLGPNPSDGGNFPYKAVGAQAAMKWDPAKDEAEGNQCKAYGAPGIMRLPGHFRISWQDDNTLKLEADYGTQTRLFHFVPGPQGGQINFQSGAYVPPVMPKMDPPAGVEASWQGYSVAQWTIMGGARNYERGGSAKVITTHLKPGYYLKNGMPYTANAVLTEHFRTLKLPDNSEWIVLVQIVDDPDYLTQPFIINYHFKKLPDGSKWDPTPCAVK
jgi:hypothetical protein